MSKKKRYRSSLQQSHSRPVQELVTTTGPSRSFWNLACTGATYQDRNLLELCPEPDPKHPKSANQDPNLCGILPGSCSGTYTGTTNIPTPEPSKTLFGTWPWTWNLARPRPEPAPELAYQDRSPPSPERSGALLGTCSRTTYQDRNLPEPCPKMSDALRGYPRQHTSE